MDGKRKHLVEWRDVLLFTCCVAVMAWQCLVVALETCLGGMGRLPHELHAAAMSAASALLLLSPWWLLPRRWRGLVWMPLVAVTLWCLMQLWYARAYDDIMPVSAYTMTQNVNNTLLASTLALVRWRDLLVALPPCLLAVLWLCCYRRHGYDGGGRLVPFCLTLAAAAVSAALGLWQPGRTVTVRDQLTHNYGNSTYFARNGLLPYLAHSLHDAAFTHKVTDADRALVREFISEQCPHYVDNSYATDRPNLVLIIVESLHTWPIGMRVDGREVTPTLNSLVTRDSVIYVPHVLFQTCHGHSSDAYLIYNTGLLPLRDAAVAVSHGAGPYPSLASALEGYDTRLAICTPAGNWNQAVTARAYGFDTLYTRHHLEQTGLLARHAGVDDAALTHLCGNLLPQFRQPFFLEMVTMTMHTPYNPGKVRDTWITRSDTLTAEARGYLNCVNLTDSCLGAFFEQLSVAGLQRSTVVAIVSDHTQLYLNRIEGRPDQQFQPRDWGIPAIIVGADTTLTLTATVGQCDIYPTLLDVMGANRYPWKGLGHSLLRYPVGSAIMPRNMSVVGDQQSPLVSQQLQAWQVSRLLINDAPHWFATPGGELWQP